MTKETFNKIMCLRSWGVITDDIKGEDKDDDMVIEVRDINEALFSLEN
jgi:hypothetical protein